MCDELGIHSLNELGHRELRFGDMGSGDGDLSHTCCSRFNMQGVAVEMREDCLKQLEARRTAAAGLVKGPETNPSNRSKAHVPWSVHRVDVIDADLRKAYVDPGPRPVDVLFLLIAATDDVTLAALLHLLHPMYLGREVLVYLMLHQAQRSVSFLSKLGLAKELIFKQQYKHEGEHGSVRTIIGFKMKKADFISLGAAVHLQDTGDHDSQWPFVWRLPHLTPLWLRKAAEDAANRLLPPPPCPPDPSETAAATGEAKPNKKRAGATKAGIKQEKKPRAGARGESNATSTAAKKREKPALEATDSSKRRLTEEQRFNDLTAQIKEEKALRRRSDAAAAKAARELVNIREKLLQQSSTLPANPASSPPSRRPTKRGKGTSTSTDAVGEEVKSSPEAAGVRAAQYILSATTSNARLGRARCLDAAIKGNVKSSEWKSMTRLNLGADPDEAAKFAGAFKYAQDRRTFKAILLKQAASEGVETDRVQRFSKYSIEDLIVIHEAGGGPVYKEEEDAAYVACLIQKHRIKEAEQSRALEEHNKKIMGWGLAQLQRALDLGLFEESWAVEAVGSRVEVLQAAEENSKDPPAAAETAPSMPAEAPMPAPSITLAVYGHDPAPVGGPPPFVSPPVASSSSASPTTRGAPRLWPSTGSAVRAANVGSGSGAN